jgi:hypothetical protein
MLPSDEGLCHESLIKYYFDRTKLMCIPFEYTGKLYDDFNSNIFYTLYHSI